MRMPSHPFVGIKCAARVEAVKGPSSEQRGQEAFAPLLGLRLCLLLLVLVLLVRLRRVVTA